MNDHDLREELRQKVSAQAHKEQRAQLVFDHRRAGGQINREFAAHLAELGFSNRDGKPWSVDLLAR